MDHADYTVPWPLAHFWYVIYLRQLHFIFIFFIPGVLYIVDSSDVARLAEAREELFAVMESDDLNGVPLVIMANKQDMPGAISPAQMIDSWQLRKLQSKWHVQGCCAISGEGIYEGMDAMARLVKENK